MNGFSFEYSSVHWFTLGYSEVHWFKFSFYKLNVDLL